MRSHSFPRFLLCAVTRAFLLSIAFSVSAQADSDSDSDSDSAGINGEIRKHVDEYYKGDFRKHWFEFVLDAADDGYWSKVERDLDKWADDKKKTGGYDFWVENFFPFTELESTADLDHREIPPFFSPGKFPDSEFLNFLYYLGDVGIGTNRPRARLHVHNGDLLVTDGEDIVFRVGAAGGASGVAIGGGESIAVDSIAVGNALARHENSVVVGTGGVTSTSPGSLALGAGSTVPSLVFVPDPGGGPATVELSADLLPMSSLEQLGSPTRRFGRLYLSDNGLHIGSPAGEGTIQYHAGALRLSDDVAINQDLHVAGDATIAGKLNVPTIANANGLTVSSDLAVNGNATVLKDLSVAQTATLNRLRVSRDAEIDETLTVKQDLSVATGITLNKRPNENLPHPYLKITNLEECGGAFHKVAEDGLIGPEFPFLRPGFGPLADTTANAGWEYGYLRTQLFTDDAGNLKCGVLANLQGLVEAVLDIGFGTTCLTLGIIGATPAGVAGFKLAEDIVCSMIDSAVRAGNAAAWVTMAAAERALEIGGGGNPDTVKTTSPPPPPPVRSYTRDDLLGDELNLLDIGIPGGPAELIALVKAQAEAPLEALSRGVVKVGAVEVPLSEFTPPHEIVLGLLETNADLLLQNPPAFVAEAARVVFQDYFDTIVSLDLVEDIIAAASRLVFLDRDGNEVFKVALDDVHTGIDLDNGTGFGINAGGNRVVSVSRDRVGIDVNGTGLQAGAGSLTINVDNATVIGVTPGDVCLLDLCKSTIDGNFGLLFGGLGSVQGLVNTLNDTVFGAGGLAGRLGTAEGTLGTLNGIVNGTGGLAERLAGLDGLVTGLRTDLDAVSDPVGALEARLVAVESALQGLSGKVAALPNNFSDFATKSGDVVFLNTARDLLGLTVNANATNIGKIIDHFDIGGIFSDVRLKTDIAPLSAALDRVLRLRGVTHAWTDEGKALSRTPDGEGKTLGFVAQEVREVVPEVVSEGGDGYLRVSYAKMAPLFVEGFKEQQAQIGALRAENEALKAYICGKDPAAGFCGG